MSHTPHVVIVGAGFGRLGVAEQLDRVPVQVTLIDRHNYHTFQPLLYQVRVQKDLTVAGDPAIFVIGDTASRDQDGKPLPGVAQVAMQQGRYAGRLIDSRIRRKDAPRSFCYADKGSMAVVGKGFAWQHRRALGARVLSRMTTQEKGAHDGNEECHARRGTRKRRMCTNHRSEP